VQPHSLPLFLLAVDYPQLPKSLYVGCKRGDLWKWLSFFPTSSSQQSITLGTMLTTCGNGVMKLRSNILELVECFGIYVAIISQKEPEQMADLLGYQQMVIHSSQNCHEGGWLVYDRHFWLKAAATGSKDWSTIGTNIWRMAFPDRLSLSTSLQTTPSTSRQTPYFSSNQSPTLGRKICLDWNDTPSPNCSYPDCKAWTSLL